MQKETEKKLQKETDTKESELQKKIVRNKRVQSCKKRHKRARVAKKSPKQKCQGCKKYSDTKESEWRNSQKTKESEMQKIVLSLRISGKVRVRV